MSLGTTATAKVPSVSVSVSEQVGSGTLPASPTYPTPPLQTKPKLKGKSVLKKKSMVVSPDLLEQFQVFLTLQGGALAKAKAKAPQQQQVPPPAAALGAPSSSRCVPVLPAALVAPSPSLPQMPRQTPASGSVVLGAAMAASSSVTDLQCLVSNQAAMARHQYQQSRDARLKADEEEVEFSVVASFTPENTQCFNVSHFSGELVSLWLC